MKYCVEMGKYCTTEVKMWCDENKKTKVRGLGWPRIDGRCGRRGSVLRMDRVLVTDVQGQILLMG